jgi:hypothetical protein
MVKIKNTGNPMERKRKKDQYDPVVKKTKKRPKSKLRCHLFMKFSQKSKLQNKSISEGNNLCTNKSFVSVFDWESDSTGEIDTSEEEYIEKSESINNTERNCDLGKNC